MTYHVICPCSGKEYSRESLVAMRQLVVKMLVKYNCKGRIRIKKGKQLYGTMWKDDGKVCFRRKGKRLVHTIQANGARR